MTEVNDFDADEEKRAHTNVAVRPFSDERFVDWVITYRNLDISRWDILTIAGNYLFVEQGDESIAYRLGVRHNAEVSDDVVLEAMAKLVDLYNIETLTKHEVDNFWRLIEKARREFEFIEHLRKPGFVEHDSCVESVIKQLPENIITSIGHDHLKKALEGYIPILKKWEATKLYYDYKLFLAECDWITARTHISPGLETLKEDATFLDRGFHMIPSQQIREGFMSYISTLCTYHFCKKAEQAKTDYMNRTLQKFRSERLSFEKRRSLFPMHFTGPIHFLVFKEREEKYILQHPVVEVAKVRAYFHGIILTRYDEVHVSG